MFQWSRNYAMCKTCGTTAIKHIATGLCSNCYTRIVNSENRGQKPIQSASDVKIMLTKEYLEVEYLTKNRSLGDIAKDCCCSRQYVFSRIKHFGITTRSKSDARTLALNGGKLIFDQCFDKQSVEKVLKKIHVNEAFFSSWSDKMAYVLGIVYTDGNIYTGNSMNNEHKSYKKVPKISIVQKEPELLEKVKKLMDCDATLYYRKEKYYNGVKSGAAYSLSLSNYALFNDLTKIGLTSDKSLDMVFPDIPREYLRHFIRGCWDGDGSVFLSSMGYICASYVCGSKEFIVKLSDILDGFGVYKGTISEQKGKNTSYKIRYHGEVCYKFFKYMYDNVDKSMYLQRKYEIFDNYYKSK